MDQILFRLREMFGEDRAQILYNNQFRLADEDSRVVAFPQTVEELSDMLQLAASERWRVIPAGAGGWLEMGNRPPQFHLIVSTARMNRVLEYEPADLTATVQAGCPLAAFNKLAAQHRQFVPLDPFGGESSTIGAIVATASSGPMRCAYGGPRDWLIGVQVVHADGKITRAGGKVVKNVAGYDLCKLYTGSYGTLGMISEMSFKLRALPPSEKTLVFYADGAGELCALVAKITDSDLQPTSCELISPSEIDSPIDNKKFALLLRFLNEPETIESQINDALLFGDKTRSIVLSGADAETFWRIYHRSETANNWDYSLKLSALPSDLNLLIDDLSRALPKTHWRAHAANGLIRVHAAAGWLDGFKPRERARKLVELRQRTQSRGGRLVMLRATGDLTDQIDVWGDAGAQTNLMRAIKEKFDPQGMLNPGRFVAGI
jgi:glycolate oxidase FAD binding subunit